MTGYHLFKPFPEIVEATVQADPYTIVDSNAVSGLPSNGMTDKQERKLFVPLDRSGRVVSLHELAHVRLSPDELPDVDFDAEVLLAVEDARINRWLREIGRPLELSPCERAQVAALAAADLQRYDLTTLILRAVAALGTNVRDDILSVAADKPALHGVAQFLVALVEDELDTSCRAGGGPVASFDDVVFIARDLAKRMGRTKRSNEKPRHACLGSVLRSSCKAADARGIRGRFSGLDVDVDSGQMAIVQAPLTVGLPRPRAMGKRSYRPAAEGSVVRYPQRLAIDGAIFRRTKREHGGSVLIDASGSMCLRAQHIDQILQSTPWATVVAMYSGHGDGGELRVVAKGRRRAATEYIAPAGGGNVVDLPALEWLAKQPAPRIWISDGHVTGKGDMRSSRLTEQCKAVRRRARIRRVCNVEEAGDLLRATR